MDDINRVESPKQNKIFQRLLKYAYIYTPPQYAIKQITEESFTHPDMFDEYIQVKVFVKTERIDLVKAKPDLYLKYAYILMADPDPEIPKYIRWEIIKDFFKGKGTSNFKQFFIIDEIFEANLPEKIIVKSTDITYNLKRKVLVEELKKLYPAQTKEIVDLINYKLFLDSLTEDQLDEQDMLLQTNLSLEVLYSLKEKLISLALEFSMILIHMGISPMVLFA
jgi:hypothetical protein